MLDFQNVCYPRMMRELAVLLVLVAVTAKRIDIPLRPAALHGSRPAAPDVSGLAEAPPTKSETPQLSTPSQAAGIRVHGHEARH